MRGQSWLEISIWDDQLTFEESRLIYEVLLQRQSSTTGRPATKGLAFISRVANVTSSLSSRSEFACIL